MRIVASLAAGIATALAVSWMWHLAAIGSCSDGECSPLGELWGHHYWLMELGGTALAFLAGAVVTAVVLGVARQLATADRRPR